MLLEHTFAAVASVPDRVMVGLRILAMVWRHYQNKGRASEEHYVFVEDDGRITYAAKATIDADGSWPTLGN